MKTKIYQSRYKNLWYDEEKKEVLIVVFETTVELDDDLYFESLREAIEVLEHYEVDYVILDYRLFDYPIAPDLQDKINVFLTPRFKKLGLKKMAVVKPSEFISALSLEQLMSEARRLLYFDTLEKARQWLYL